MTIRLSLPRRLGRLTLAGLAALSIAGSALAENLLIIATSPVPPGKFKASGTGQGGIWHLALAGMLSDLKIGPASEPA